MYIHYKDPISKYVKLFAPNGGIVRCCTWIDTEAKEFGFWELTAGTPETFEGSIVGGKLLNKKNPVTGRWELSESKKSAIGYYYEIGDGRLFPIE